MNKSIKKQRFEFSLHLLLLSVFFAPLRSYGLMTVAGLNFSFFRFFGLLMIITLIISFVRYSTKIRLDTFILLISSIIFYNFFTLLYSDNITNSHFLAMTVGLIWLLSSYLLLRERQDAIIKVIKTLILSSIFPVGLGIYQSIYFSINSMLPPMPFSNFLVSEGKTGLTYNIYLRISSTFLDPSYYGMFLVIVGITSFGILINASRNKYIFGKKFIRTCYIAFPVSIIAIFQTLSLTSIAGFLTGCIIVFSFQNNNGKLIRNSIIALALIFCLIPICNSLFGSDVFQSISFKLNNQYDNYGLSFGREAYFKYGLEKFAESPIFGVGFGGLSIGSGIISSAHNTLLTILGQQGMIGLVLHLILLFGYPLSRILRFKNYDNKLLSITTYAAVVGMVVVSFGYDAMYKIDTGYVAILITGVIIANQKIDYKFNVNSRC